MKKGFLQNMISKHYKIHILTGLVLSVVFVLSVFISSPNIAPEFSGQSNLDITFESVKSQEEISAKLNSLPYEIELVENSQQNYILNSRALLNDEYLSLLEVIENDIGPYSINAYQSFSPSISQELIRKAIIALIFASIIIVIYISFVFRGVSRPISSWKYGVVSIVTLIHDMIAPIGIFALIAPFTSASIDVLFVTALLATLGYSINDTIIIFDRIRDRLKNNVLRKNKEEFGDTIDYGVKKSLRRSMFTSISTIIPLALLFVFVPITKWFGAALFIGIIAGTYSSLLFAPSLLLLWHKKFPQSGKEKKEKNETEIAEDNLMKNLHNVDTI